MNKKTISYVALLNPNILPGVFTKIKHTLHSLEKNGHSADYVLINERNSLDNVKKFFIQVWNSKSDILIIRHNALICFLFPALIYQRLQKNVIIIDVPTPNKTAVSEIYNDTRLAISKKLKNILFLYLTVPLSLLPASKILQYSNESWYFSLGVNKKTLLISNGINVDDIPSRIVVPKWPDKSFFLIGVASLPDWHGFDRVIRGIAIYLKGNTEDKVNVEFIIVGDGEIKKALEDLSFKLGVSEKIVFCGRKSGKDLDLLFQKAHVGVSSLGLFRNNLRMASPLKSREYTARGIPFIRSGYDLDFDPKPDFVLDFVNNDSPVDIDQLINWYSSLAYDESYSILVRNYAVKNLDFSNKAKVFL